VPIVAHIRRQVKGTTQAGRRFVLSHQQGVAPQLITEARHSCCVIAKEIEVEVVAIKRLMLLNLSDASRNGFLQSR
jgi:hypothetical protein